MVEWTTYDLSFEVAASVRGGLRFHPQPEGVGTSRSALSAPGVKIGDIERYGGLYILGKAGTGKSNLLISLALQDIEQGHGLLFIDPHSDAITAILERIPAERIKDVILLDPTDSKYAFGINPLYCANPQDLRERELSFGQTRDIFAKLTMLFGESDEKLKVLLSKYLRNILYPLIENPGSTL